MYNIVGKKRKRPDNNPSKKTKRYFDECPAIRFNIKPTSRYEPQFFEVYEHFCANEKINRNDCPSYIN